MSSPHLMGGAIPLQQPAAPAGTGDFPYPSGTNCRYVNCGRAALRLILQHLPTAPARVWIPRFVCDTVAEAPASLGVPVLRYNITEQLHPILPHELRENDVVVLVNYFGLTAAALEEAARACPCPVVADATTALYSPAPQGIPAFYSPRKFAGLADGGIAVAPFPLATDLPEDAGSDHRTAALLQDASPQRVQEAEDALCAIPKNMGTATQRLMLSTPWAAYATRRIRNYHCLHRSLQHINRLSLPQNPQHAPICYPLVCGIPGLRDSLIDAGVRLPLYWPEVIEATDATQTENKLARTLLPLPLDQRYTPEDMERLVELIMN